VKPFCGVVIVAEFCRSVELLLLLGTTSTGVDDGFGFLPVETVKVVSSEILCTSLAESEACPKIIVAIVLGSFDVVEKVTLGEVAADVVVREDVTAELEVAVVVGVVVVFTTELQVVLCLAGLDPFMGGAAQRNPSVMDPS
jgi:hypothetical protein